jgi:putative transcriptional regulator
MRTARTVAGLVVVVLLVATAAPEGGATLPAHRSLAGRLLVATDVMGDTRFAKTVIYMVRHSERGALGVIVNLPIAEVPYERVLRTYGLEAPQGSGDVRVHYGGPLEETSTFVLHTPEWAGDGTTVVDGGFALTADPTVLQAMARGAGPRRALFCLGRAGWAPGQLDVELETGAWAVASTDERLLFDEDPKQKWIEAMTRRILEL